MFVLCDCRGVKKPLHISVLLSTVHGSSADTGTTFHPRRTFDPLCATPDHREVAAHYNCLQIVRPRLRCTSSCQAPMLLRFHLRGGTFARSRYSFGSVRPRQTTRQPRLFGRESPSNVSRAPWSLGCTHRFLVSSVFLLAPLKRSNRTPKRDTKSTMGV